MEGWIRTDIRYVNQKIYKTYRMRLIKHGGNGTRREYTIGRVRDLQLSSSYNINSGKESGQLQPNPIMASCSRAVFDISSITITAAFLLVHLSLIPHDSPRAIWRESATNPGRTTAANIR